jgi:hypothetical protein
MIFFSISAERQPGKNRFKLDSEVSSITSFACLVTPSSGINRPLYSLTTAAGSAATGKPLFPLIFNGGNVYN